MLSDLVRSITCSCEDDQYGYCEEPTEQVDLERLEPRPVATLSLDAQERPEHRRRQNDDQLP